QAQAMLSFSSSEEIRKLFFKLNTNKAPGLDGLTSGFIKSAWDFVGEEAIASVKHFFTYLVASCLVSGLYLDFWEGTFGMFVLVPGDNLVESWYRSRSLGHVVCGEQ
ncbi:hypothetical protein HID58_013611, partial [Brassica napus]